MSYKFYGQGGVDKILFEECKIDFKNGKFIELGAYDGISYSNTFFFEKELNWSGVLIEPGAKNYAKLIKFSQQWRPNSICLNYAIGHKVEEVEFIEEKAVGGCVSHLTEKHCNKFNLTNIPTQLCKVAPMRDIVTPNMISCVDLFSIDVEGNELAVLETFNWDIPVKYILVEINDDYKNCEQFLQAKHFTHKRNILNNGLWENLAYVI